MAKYSYYVQQFMDIARAVSDESRVRLLMALGGRELCVCQLIELLDLAPSTVSKHLQLLRQAGLVESSKRGRWIYYRRAGEGAPALVRNTYSWLQHCLALDLQVRADGEQLQRVCCIDPEVLSHLQSQGPAYVSGLTLLHSGATMNKIRVLFLCTGNSARSQMAEAWLNHLGGDRFKAYSAGLEPKGINPLTYEAMAEAGLDLAGQQSKGVEQYLGREAFDYVITLCDHAQDHCPTNFPGPGKRLHWSFEDPAAAEGGDEQRLSKFRTVRDSIAARISDWMAELGQPVAQTKGA
jgi:arsenate reductase